ncbi:hypothetical protein Plec18167_002542 [Paecilomyces lecythidis]|uniref:Uncharacterized protein n=1 Tax=Paecilomyces lecythidis TaxID=3004212 RepID=A0ABR3Y5G2_9EURO
MECSGNNGLGWREYVSQSQFPILENPQNSHEKRTSQRKKKLLPRKQTPEQQRLSASLRALVQSFSRSRRTGSRLMAAHFDLGVPTHGLKRPADSDPDGDQPLTKKFNRLHIGPLHDGNAFAPQHAPVPRPPSPNDSMLLDDTAHTTYVYDLDREFKEIEAQEGCIAFLPEIEKRLISIPKAVLADSKPQNNELVLYQVPTSLSVPKEQDSVRKAIIESRARAREKQAEKQRRNSTENQSQSQGDIQIQPRLVVDALNGSSNTAPDVPPNPPDTMEID